MREMQRKIDVDNIAIGMFVSGLDRPWEQTPFPVHGFYIREPSEVKQLKSHCQHIYIDTKKGVAPPEDTTTIDPASARYKGKLEPITATPIYEITTPLQVELPRAFSLFDLANQALTVVMQEARQGDVSSLGALSDVAEEIVNSVTANPDAMAWSVSVRKNRRELPWLYLIRTMTMALLLGRRLGLSKGELKLVALTALLKDIGRFVQLEGTIDEKKAQWINHTCTKLRQISGINPKVIKLIQSHREVLNGSGYPQGLRGDRIPLSAKIVGLSTFVEESAFQRRSMYPIQSSQVVSCLYKVRGALYQDDLIAELISAIGLYPTGSLVSLESGDIAIVVEQNYEFRLKPTVMLLVDSNSQLLDKPQVLNLQQLAAKKSPQGEIDKDLPMADYHLDLDAIRDQWLEQFQKKSLLSRFFN